ncbi:DUF898 family protein [Raineyella fluvialis]|uniref:DUF898 family protein n=1 Tax=Raineyella fluvialis TaxID=2662261 RepID=A0A5Q2F705_9ACTN|nr:DUF898 family protein [Raineyella fluvialis]
MSESSWSGGGAQQPSPYGGPGPGDPSPRRSNPGPVIESGPTATQARPAAPDQIFGVTGEPPVPATLPQPAAPVASPTAWAVPLTFKFTGGAGSFLGMQILAFLVTVLTLGICYPWAVVMRYRWQANHTFVNGAPMRFTGSAIGLFGQWIKWLLLMIVTLGIYSFWVIPRMTRWVVEHQEVVIQVPVAPFPPA